MTELLSVPESQHLALSALVVAWNVESGHNPGIVEVEAVSSAVASEMKTLGYAELSPDLLRALTGVGIVKKASRNKVLAGGL
jgi:hypothetical protein